MPLKVVKPSAAVSEVIREHLGDISSVGRFRTERLSAASPANLSLAAPHPVYNLGLSDIKGRSALAKAKLTGWRYLVLEDGAAIAAAEAVQPSARAKPMFSHTNEGPFVGSTAKAIEEAEQIPEIQKGQYELRVLRVPALYLVTLWLKSTKAKSQGEIFIPLDPTPPGIKSGERMNADELNAALLSLKAERGDTTKTSS